MAKIGITVSADKKSISKVNHTVNDALKNEYNEYLHKIKTISLLKLITSLLGIIQLSSAICFFTDIFNSCRIFHDVRIKENQRIDSYHKKNQKKKFSRRTILVLFIPLIRT